MEIKFKSEASRECCREIALLFHTLLVWFLLASLLLAIFPIILHLYQAAHHDKYKVIEMTLDSRYRGGGRRGNGFLMLKGTYNGQWLSILSDYVPELEELTEVKGLPLKIRYWPEGLATVAPYGMTRWDHVQRAANALVPFGVGGLLWLTLRRLDVQPKWLVRPQLWNRQAVRWMPPASPPRPPPRKRSMTARARLRRRFRR